jgi:HEAT repeat protein
MGKQICVQAGKTAGSCVRGVVSVSKKTGKVGTLIKKCVDSTANATIRMCARLGNLCKSISTDGQLAAWDEKQKDVYLRLGEEIFRGIKEKPESLLEQENVKNLLEQAGENESHIQEIKEATALQKHKMDGIAIFKQAKDNLQSKDPRMRRVAIRLFDRLGDKKAIPLLTKALEDPDSEVRERAARVLHKFADIAQASGTNESREEEDNQEKKEEQKQESDEEE